MVRQAADEGYPRWQSLARHDEAGFAKERWGDCPEMQAFEWKNAACMRELKEQG